MPSPTSSEPRHPPQTSPFYPAGILETAGIKLCIVGNGAVAHFGSDLVIAALDLAIADEQFERALTILHDKGFHDVNFNRCQLAIMPAMGKPGGWVARRLHYPPSSANVVLSLASCWHLDINPDTTFLPYADSYRFPKFLVYLEGLIRIIDTQVSLGDSSIHFSYLYAIMAELLAKQPELGLGISVGDQFFNDFYLKQIKRSDVLRVLELRKSIMAGTISVDAAREVVPRPDLARKRMKENYHRQRKERENGHGDILMA